MFLEWEGRELKVWRHEPNVAWKRQELTVCGLGHHLIRRGQIVYMAPALLLHYILGHQYRPPDELVTAVIEGRFLTPNDLVFRPSMPLYPGSQGRRLKLPKKGWLEE